MINYFYDPKTKEFTEERPAQLSKKGTPLPALNSTKLKPIKAKDGYAVVFDGKKWVHVEDHRQKQDAMQGKIGGTAYWLPEDDWQSQARYMTELGPLPKDALLERPLPPLDVAKDNKKNDLRSEYQMSLVGSVKCVGLEINASEQALKDINDLIDNYTKTVNFRLFDNTFFEVSKDTLELFREAVYEFLQSKRQKMWDYKDMIDACKTNADLDKLTFTFGE